MAFKSVKQRISEWLPSNYPLGCDGSSVCTFNGTDSDFQGFRQQWVSNCAAINASGLLQSKKNALGQCQAAFDMSTNGLQMSQYAENQQQFNEVKANTERNTKTAIFLFFVVLFIALIVYLLTS